MRSQIIYTFYVTVALLASAVKAKTHLGGDYKLLRAGIIAPRKTQVPEVEDWVKLDAGHAERLSAKHSTCIGADVCFFYTRIESKEHVITVTPRLQGHATTSPSSSKSIQFERRAPVSNSSPRPKRSQARKPDPEYYEELKLRGRFKFSKSGRNFHLEFVKDIEKLRKWSQDHLKRDFNDDKSFCLVALHYFSSQRLFRENFEESKALETLDVLKAEADDPEYITRYYNRIRLQGYRDSHHSRQQKKQYRAKQTQPSAGPAFTTGGESSKSGASSNPSGFPPDNQDRGHSLSVDSAAEILQGTGRPTHT
ncbi:hypothetical protein F5880DRAFT_468332 [Lentinula raphanica]|nr:hypothetical protein F5880DRAFT_468332 [Lentinula raphanica]